MDRQRRFLLWLTALALASVAAQAVTGMAELTLYLTPLFLIASLLLSGNFVAEDRIVARWRAARPAPRRRTEPRQRLPRSVRPVRLFERSSLTRRGPPAVALTA